MTLVFLLQNASDVVPKVQACRVSFCEELVACTLDDRADEDILKFLAGQIQIRLEVLNQLVGREKKGSSLRLTLAQN